MSSKFWSDVRQFAARESHSNYVAGREQQQRTDRQTNRQKSETARGRRSLERDMKRSHDKAVDSLRSTKDKKKAREHFKNERERALNQYDNKNNPKNEEIKKTGSNPENGDGGSAGGGGGVPEGYVEVFVTICQDGAPVLGEILFKFDE